MKKIHVGILLNKKKQRNLQKNFRVTVSLLLHRKSVEKLDIKISRFFCNKNLFLDWRKSGLSNEIKCFFKFAFLSQNYFKNLSCRTDLIRIQFSNYFSFFYFIKKRQNTTWHHNQNEYSKSIQNKVWVFIYELSGCEFEFRFFHLKFRKFESLTKPK